MPKFPNNELSLQLKIEQTLKTMKHTTTLLFFILFANLIFAQQTKFSPKGELHIPLPTSWTNTSNPGEIHIFASNDDVTPPTVNLNHNIYEEVFENNFTISGTATDQSGIKEVLLNNENIGSTSFSKKVILTQGKNKFILKATDKKGNTNPKEIFIVYTKKEEIVDVVNKDTKKPLISLNHGTNIKHKQEQFTISGKATDESGIFQVLLNGDRIGTNNFSKNVILKDGENIFILEVTDKKLNISKKEITITYTPPKEELIAGKNYALFFAVQDYKGTENDLQNPIKDANAIANKIKNNFNFTSEIIQNPTKEDIILKINEYQDKKYGEKDQLFIHFSGHGFASDQGYFLPSDANFKAKTELSYWSFAEMELKLTAIPCKHILLVLDACHSSTFSKDILFGEYYSLRKKPNAQPPNEKSERQTFVDNAFKKQSRWVITASVNSISDGKNHSKLTENFIGSKKEYGVLTKQNFGNDKIIQFSELESYIEENNKDAKIRTFQNHEIDGNFLFIVK